MMPIQCASCKNYISDAKCKAFEKIPIKILRGIIDHTKPYKGDNGIQFEPLTE